LLCPCGETASFCAKRLCGIEPSGAPGGDGAGYGCGDGEDDDDGGEDAPVEGAHAVEHFAQELNDGGAAGEAEDEAEEDGCEAVDEGEAHDLCALRAERDADTELASALGDEIGEDAV
jgi:hypothetical protein